ncbi:MAG: DUF3142 domain-containing protein [Akkermansiaceae bacterium]|nr:DUF3142 domain-containing protein [Akkermansiaceae bacterium]
MRRFVPLACVVLALAGCGGKRTVAKRAGPMEPPAFWVWHRSSAFHPAELTSLREAGVERLFQQVAECRWAGGSWQVKRIAPAREAPSGIEVVPVFRLAPDASFLGNPSSAGALAERVRAWSEAVPIPAEVQLDFDCPDRVLGEYAAFLERFAEGVSPSSVSITALAAWPRHPEFQRLAKPVRAFYPMFYDLVADKPEDVLQGRFVPLADPASGLLIRAWRVCPKPWFAGLPNFERVSRFGADGRLEGHLRDWDAGSLMRWNAPEISEHGVTIQKEGGRTTVHRIPHETELRELIECADESGASGVIFFALPGPGTHAAYTPSHLARKAPPRLRVEVGPKGEIELHNPGPADLPTRICDPEDASRRGWTLVLSGSPGMFGASFPGEFEESDTGNVPAEMTSRIRFRFPALPAGAMIRSGPVLPSSAVLAAEIEGAPEIRVEVASDSAR